MRLRSGGSERWRRAAAPTCPLGAARLLLQALPAPRIAAPVVFGPVNRRSTPSSEPEKLVRPVAARGAGVAAPAGLQAA